MPRLHPWALPFADLNPTLLQDSSPTCTPSVKPVSPRAPASVGFHPPTDIQVAAMKGLPHEIWSQGALNLSPSWTPSKLNFFKPGCPHLAGRD